MKVSRMSLMAPSCALGVLDGAVVEFDELTQLGIIEL